MEVLCWHNMITSLDPTILHVIIDSKSMIAKCLSCEQLKTGCSSTADFIRFLDRNLDKEYDR